MPSRTTARIDEPTPSAAPRRGVAWVLGWAFSLCVFAATAVVLVQLVYVIAAEHVLLAATQEAVLEATLPRATHASVQAAFQRQLSSSQLAAAGRLVFTHNGVPVTGPVRCRPGDRLTVAVAAPVDDVLPAWFKQVNRLLGPATIAVQSQEIADRG